MTREPNERTPSKLALGQYLASVRLSRGLTLRQVEESIKQEFSNGYLSQLETGKILKPSPNVLHRLSGVYDVDYDNLMRLAGYIPVSSEKAGTHTSKDIFAEMELTKNEAAKLLHYLNYLRFSKDS